MVYGMASVLTPGQHSSGGKARLGRITKAGDPYLRSLLVMGARARHFATWFGLTPREFSSGDTRVLGRISKRGDRYLRMLLTHGARSVLRAATVAREVGRSMDGLRTWALTVQGRTNHNKAACALANKMARICYATLRDATPYGKPAREGRKINRESFAIAA